MWATVICTAYLHYVFMSYINLTTFSEHVYRLPYVGIGSHAPAYPFLSLLCRKVQQTAFYTWGHCKKNTVVFFYIVINVEASQWQMSATRMYSAGVM